MGDIRLTSANFTWFILKYFAPYEPQYTVQYMKFSIKDFFSKCDQIRRLLRIWSHLLKKSLMENFIYCAVKCDSVSVPLILQNKVIELKQHRNFFAKCEVLSNNRNINVEEIVGKYELTSLP